MITGQNPQEIIGIVYKVNMKLLGHARREEIELMAGTIATESHFYQRVQLNRGPARGVFQIEPDTAKDIYENYLRYKPELYKKFMDIVFYMGSAPFFIPQKDEIDKLLMLCDDYSAGIARMVYLRQRPPIPKTLEDQAAYYKLWFNTPAGKGSVEKYLRDWESCKCEELVRPFIRMDTGEA